MKTTIALFIAFLSLAVILTAKTLDYAGAYGLALGDSIAVATKAMAERECPAPVIDSVQNCFHYDCVVEFLGESCEFTTLYEVNGKVSTIKSSVDDEQTNRLYKKLRTLADLTTVENGRMNFQFENCIISLHPQGALIINLNLVKL